MKKAIVTGATGFIGGALAKRLLADGVKVYGVGRNAERLAALKECGDFVPVVADFAEYDRLHETITDGDIDVFYHFALSGSYGPSVKDYSLQLYNAEGACKSATAAAKIGCGRFVLAGTANEYEVIQYLNSRNFALRHTNIYSVCKMAAGIICNTIVTNANISFNGGLIAMSYGVGNYSSASVVNAVINQLLKGDSPKLIGGESLYDIIYIDDIVDAFLAMGERGEHNKNYYIGHRKLRTFKEIFADIGAVVNPNVELLFGAYSDASKMDYAQIDKNALYNDTGFEAKADFKESILKTAEWLKSQSAKESLGGGVSHKSHPARAFPRGSSSLRRSRKKVAA
jgi:nucleoside-diphosphate-sugar epimerase